MQERSYFSGQLWSVQQVSLFLAVPERTVRYWASTEVLRGCKFGKLWRFGPPEVEVSARRLGRKDSHGGRHGA